MKSELEKSEGGTEDWYDKSTVKRAGEVCPHCLERIEAATNMFGPTHQPKPGDFTVCSHCAKVCRWTEGMYLDKSSLKEAYQAHLQTGADIEKLIAAMKKPPRGPGRLELGSGKSRVPVDGWTKRN